MNKYREKYIKLSHERLRLRLAYDMAVDSETKRMIVRQIADIDNRTYNEVIEPYMLERGHTQEDIYEAIKMEIARGCNESDDIG